MQFCHQGRDLEDRIYLDAINSILISGEYPSLFTNDEMDGLLQVSFLSLRNDISKQYLQALTPSLKREHPNVNIDLMKYFISRVMAKLHIIICLPPQHWLLDVLHR